MKDMFNEIPQSRRFGYTRVSSSSQNDRFSLESQKEELLKRGVLESNIREEIGSATYSLSEQSVLRQLIDQELQEGDMLLVTKMDRCGRNILDFLKLQEKLWSKSVTFVALDLPYSNDIVLNKSIAHYLASVAHAEKVRTKERQRKGIEHAKRAGKYKGRKTVITDGLIEQVRDLKENKHLTVTEIAKITHKARTTIYKILKNELDYVPAHKLFKKE
uniref:putative serine recombinase n=1 Tax=Cocconeiopsis kantsiensis TaxID=3082010 RepID=UPI003003915C